MPSALRQKTNQRTRQPSSRHCFSESVRYSQWLKGSVRDVLDVTLPGSWAAFLLPSPPLEMSWPCNTLRMFGIPIVSNSYPLLCTPYLVIRNESPPICYRRSRPPQVSHQIFGLASRPGFGRKVPRMYSVLRLAGTGGFQPCKRTCETRVSRVWDQEGRQLAGSYWCW